MATLPQEALNQLKLFISVLKGNPNLLHTPDLHFLKEYLESLGATIPPKQEAPQAKSHKHEPVPEPVDVEEDTKPEPAAEEPAEPPEPVDPHLWSAESDTVHFDLGDPKREVTETDEERANDLLSEARGLAREGNYDAAIEKLTEAIKHNPKQSNLFAFRAEYFLHQKKPNAVIRDANRALELNPDSSRALKSRGKARRYLGHYLDAHYDLSQGNSLDWDESTAEIIKEISERAERAKQHQRKENEKHRIEALKREAAEKRRREQDEEDKRHRDYSGGAPGMDAFADIFNDPEIMGLLQKDPSLMTKLSSYMTGSAPQYANDPDVKKVMELLLKKATGAGMPGAGAGAGAGAGTGAGHGHSHAGPGHGHAHSGAQSKPRSGEDDLD